MKRLETNYNSGSFDDCCMFVRNAWMCMLNDVKNALMDDVHVVSFPYSFSSAGMGGRVACPSFEVRRFCDRELLVDFLEGRSDVVRGADLRKAVLYLNERSVLNDPEYGAFLHAMAQDAERKYFASFKK